MRTLSVERLCALCGREVSLTFHHLIPKKVHRRARFKQDYSKQDLQQGIMICRLCHKGIHKMFDEMTLAKNFNSLASLRNDEQVQRHVKWVRKQKRAS